MQRILWRTSEVLKRRVRPHRDAVVARYPQTSRLLIRRPAMQSLRWQRLFWTDPDRPVAPLPYTEASVAAVLRHAGELGPADRVLEVGSGLGSTLAALVDHGVTNVTGVEINPLAVERMRELHPQLRDVEVLVGPAEDVLAAYENDSFALIVAVRTLRHTHPDSAHLFGTLARLAPKIVTIDEPAYLGRHAFPWDFAAEFSQYGMQVTRRRPLLVDGRATTSTVLTMGRHASNRRLIRSARAVAYAAASLGELRRSG
ncbi:class I SAM-dependent methyltransferase [Demetria terragena]|uniref:class I SAM-dependent methyltransferase n=1 Tax=Demetria terragena TaxID=63959 RepID=UPI000372A210|nr:class I SAM-dependent methyltransferase [Demetria terragena]